MCFYNILQVLLALERIEQDEELSYEVVNFQIFGSSKLTRSFKYFPFVLQQLLVLETNLLLNGLNFYDQHRDMRLDIDDMSYEVCFFVMIILQFSRNFVLACSFCTSILFDTVFGFSYVIAFYWYHCRNY